jgi:hypothetical protein
VACRPKKKLGKSSIEKKRQDKYEDTGFCSSINQTRQGTTDGIAGPRLKLETTQNSEVINGCVVPSKFLSSKVGPKRNLYFDPMHPNQHQRFAARIHVDNVFECMRLSVTDLQSKCACHCDEHNSFNPAFSAVVGMSVVRRVGGQEVRISINAQARKLVDKSLSRSKKYLPMLEMVMLAYESMPES